MMFNRNFHVVKNSVCSVAASSGTGTGWLYRMRNNTTIDKTIYVVTAAHIVMSKDVNNNDIINDPSVLICNVNNSRNNQMFQTKVISVDKKGDIALLEIQNHRGENNKYPLNWPKHTTLKVSVNRQEVGIPIYIVGYSLACDYNSLAGGYLRENNASDYFTPTSLYYNLATNPGNSGSPVFNPQNEVIGMLQWSLGDAAEMNGGIRGDLLYHFLDSSITSFIESGRNTYNTFFKKNIIGFFEDALTSFIPLNCEIIKQYIDILNWGTAYNNGGKNINGVLLVFNGYYTNLVLESIVYTNFRNITKTIILSSSIYDGSSIWEVNYFGKPGSSVTLNLYNMEINETFTTTLQLQEMSSVVDYFLTDGFSKKESYGKVINNLKNIDNCHEVKEMIVKNTESLLDNIRSTI